MSAKKRAWKKRVYTADQKARRLDWARAYRQRPDLRAHQLAQKRAGMKRYYERHRETVKARARTYDSRNKEKVRERRRAYYETNKSALLAQQHERYRAERDVILRRHRDYYLRNRERLKARARQHYEQAPDRYREYRWARRARELQAPGRFTDREFAELVRAFDGRCAYCGCVDQMTPDHRIPLARPELSATNNIENILPACRPCNVSKGTKTEEEYREWLSRMAVRNVKRTKSRT